MALITKSIDKSRVFNLEKGELKEIENKTLEMTAFTFFENADGEVVTAFTTKEIPDKFYFGSGVVKDFLVDNINEVPTEPDGTRVFAEEDHVYVRFCGKKLSKNNRQFNDWVVTVKID